MNEPTENHQPTPRDEHAGATSRPEPRQSTGPTEPTPATPRDASAGKARRLSKRGKWIALALAGVLGLGVIVLMMLPAFVSSSTGTRWLAGWINQRIPGQVEIADMTISYSQGPQLKNLTLRDPDGDVVARIAHVQVPRMGIWPLLRGSRNLGPITIRQGTLRLKRDADGQTNFHQALGIAAPGTASAPGSDPAPGTASAPGAGDPDASSRQTSSASDQTDAQQTPIELGTWRGELNLTDFAIHVEQQGQPEAHLAITQLDVSLLDPTRIKGLLDAQLSQSDQEAGRVYARIALKDLFDGQGSLQPSQATLEAQVQVDQVPAAGVSQLLQWPDAMTTLLGSTLQGQLVLWGDPDALTLDGELHSEHAGVQLALVYADGQVRNAQADAPALVMNLTVSPDAGNRLIALLNPQPAHAGPDLTQAWPDAQPLPMPQRARASIDFDSMPMVQHTAASNDRSQQHATLMVTEPVDLRFTVDDLAVGVSESGLDLQQSALGANLHVQAKGIRSHHLAAAALAHGPHDLSLPDLHVNLTSQRLDQQIEGSLRGRIITPQGPVDLQGKLELAQLLSSGGGITFDRTQARLTLGTLGLPLELLEVDPQLLEPLGRLADVNLTARIEGVSPRPDAALTLDVHTDARSLVAQVKGKTDLQTLSIDPASHVALALSREQAQRLIDHFAAGRQLPAQLTSDIDLTLHPAEPLSYRLDGAGLTTQGPERADDKNPADRGSPTDHGGNQALTLPLRASMPRVDVFLTDVQKPATIEHLEVRAAPTLGPDESTVVMNADVRLAGMPAAKLMLEASAVDVATPTPMVQRASLVLREVKPGAVSQVIELEPRMRNLLGSTIRELSVVATPAGRQDWFVALDTQVNEAKVALRGRVHTEDKRFAVAQGSQIEVNMTPELWREQVQPLLPDPWVITEPAGMVLKLNGLDVSYANLDLHDFALDGELRVDQVSLLNEAAQLDQPTLIRNVRLGVQSDRLGDKMELRGQVMLMLADALKQMGVKKADRAEAPERADLGDTDTNAPIDPTVTRVRLTLADFLGDDGLSLNPDSLTADFDLRADRVDMAAVDSLADMQGLLTETLSRTAAMRVQGQYPGPIDVTATTDTASLRAPIHVSRLTVTLRDQLTGSLHLTEKALRGWLGDLHPFLADAVQSVRPVELVIEPQGLHVPLATLGKKLPDRMAGTLSLGSMQMRRDGWLRQSVRQLVAELMEKMRIGRADQVRNPADAPTYVAQFTPLNFQLSFGRLTTDELWMYADDMAVGAQGSVNLSRNEIDKMYMGLVGASIVTELRSSRVLNLAAGGLRADSIYDVQIKGNLDSPGIDPTPLIASLLGDAANQTVRVFSEDLADLFEGIGKAVQESDRQQRGLTWNPPPPVDAFIQRTADPEVNR